MAVSLRERTQAMADELFAVVRDGSVKIRIDRCYPLAQAARAHCDLEPRTTTTTTGCTMPLTQDNRVP
jgi:NADPH2:quinone reductase